MTWRSGPRDLHSDRLATAPRVGFQVLYRLEKKVKHRFTGGKPKPNETGADVGGDSVDSTGSESLMVADETNLSWESTASATAKLLSVGVRLCGSPRGVRQAARRVLYAFRPIRQGFLAYT